MTGRRDALERVPALGELLRHQAWLARRSQLAELGIDSDDVARQVAARRWRMVSPSVVAATTGWLSPRQQLWLAVLHPPGPAMIAGVTALTAVGLRNWSRPIVTLVQHGRRPDGLRDIQFRATRNLPELEPLGAGMPPCCSRARAVVDACAWEPSPRTAAALAIAVVQQRILDVPTLREELARTRRHPHRDAVSAALDDAAAGSESLGEADVAALVRRAGLPEPVRQSSATDGLGGARSDDLVVRLADGSILVLKVDGTTHFDPRAIWDDQLSDAGAVAAGRLVLRIPGAMARLEPDTIVAQLVRIRVAAEQRARRNYRDDARDASSGTWWGGRRAQ